LVVQHAVNDGEGPISFHQLNVVTLVVITAIRFTYQCGPPYKSPRCQARFIFNTAARSLIVFPAAT
jgi:hypothetical protein